MTAAVAYRMNDNRLLSFSASTVEILTREQLNALSTLHKELAGIAAMLSEGGYSFGNFASAQQAIKGITASFQQIGQTKSRTSALQARQNIESILQNLKGTDIRTQQVRRTLKESLKKFDKIMKGNPELKVQKTATLKTAALKKDAARPTSELATGRKSPAQIINLDKAREARKDPSVQRDGAKTEIKNDGAKKPVTGAKAGAKAESKKSTPQSTRGDLAKGKTTARTGIRASLISPLRDAIKAAGRAVITIRVPLQRGWTNFVSLTKGSIFSPRQEVASPRTTGQSNTTNVSGIRTSPASVERQSVSEVRVSASSISAPETRSAVQLGPDTGKPSVSAIFAQETGIRTFVNETAAPAAAGTTNNLIGADNATSSLTVAGNDTKTSAVTVSQSQVEAAGAPIADVTARAVPTTTPQDLKESQTGASGNGLEKQGGGSQEQIGVPIDKRVDPDPTSPKEVDAIPVDPTLHHEVDPIPVDPNPIGHGHDEQPVPSQPLERKGEPAESVPNVKDDFDTTENHVCGAGCGHGKADEPASSEDKPGAEKVGTPARISEEDAVRLVVNMHVKRDAESGAVFETSDGAAIKAVKPEQQQATFANLSTYSLD